MWQWAIRVGDDLRCRRRDPKIFCRGSAGRHPTHWPRDTTGAPTNGNLRKNWPPRSWISEAFLPRQPAILRSPPRANFHHPCPTHTRAQQSLEDACGDFQRSVESAHTRRDPAYGAELDHKLVGICTDSYGSLCPSRALNADADVPSTKPSQSALSCGPSNNNSKSLVPGFKTLRCRPLISLVVSGPV